MPLKKLSDYKEGHFKAIRKMIIDAAKASEKYDFSVDMVSNAKHTTTIQKSIVQNLANNDIVVVDVSSKNPNVLFELGMRLTFDKPTVIIQDDSESFEFDYGSIEHLVYPREYDYISMQDFQNDLTEKIQNTMDRAIEEGDKYSQYLRQYGDYTMAEIPDNNLGNIQEAIEALMTKVDAIDGKVENSTKRSNSVLHETNMSQGNTNSFFVHSVMDDDTISHIHNLPTTESSVARSIKKQLLTQISLRNLSPDLGVEQVNVTRDFESGGFEAQIVFSNRHTGEMKVSYAMSGGELSISRANNLIKDAVKELKI